MGGKTLNQEKSLDFCSFLKDISSHIEPDTHYMFVATLIANPKKKNISQKNIDETLQALKGQSVDILSEKTAIDIRVNKEPDTLEQVWRYLQKDGIDLVFQLLENRRKKILLADMDSTIIQQECIDELAFMAGVGEEVSEITKKAMNGELDFEDALKARVSLLKGQPFSIIQSVLNDRITLMPGSVPLLKTMKANKAYCALVSGGFTAFTQIIADTLGFDEHRANTLLSDNERLTGCVGMPILGKDAKAFALKTITAHLKASYDDVLAVGDGANDLAMLQLAGSGVALHAKPTVAAASKIKLNFADLTGLLYLQGFRDSEIIFD